LLLQIISCQKKSFDDFDTIDFNNATIEEADMQEPDRLAPPILLEGLHGIDLCEDGIDQYRASTGTLTILWF